MKIARQSLLILLSIITGLFSICWQALSFVLSSLDYDPDFEDDADTSIWYNHRTGEIDPVKRIDGIYQDKL